MRKRKAFSILDNLITIIIMMIMAAFLFPTFNRARENGRRSRCQSNLKQIGLAFKQYAQDADEHAPPLANANGGWSQLITPYLKSAEIFQCPSTRRDVTGTTDYFFNARLAGAKNKLIQRDKPLYTILCGEGADDANASSNLSQFPARWRGANVTPEFRHLETANFLFVDGHVKAFQPKRIFAAPDAKAQAATPAFEAK